MTKRRKLKKLINYICSDLFSEGIAVSLYNNDKKREDINALLASIIITRNDYICRISHVEPGVKARLYFEKLKEDFSIQVSEITDNIANL